MNMLTVTVSGVFGCKGPSDGVPSVYVYLQGSLLAAVPV